MMTREEKKEWLENADPEKLLKHYDTIKRIYEKTPFAVGAIQDWELTRAEMITRLSRY